MSRPNPTGKTSATAATSVVAPMVSRFCPIVSNPRDSVPRRTHAGNSSAVAFWTVNMSALSSGIPSATATNIGRPLRLDESKVGSITASTIGTIISDQMVTECSTVTAAISAATIWRPGSGHVLRIARRGRSRRRSKRIQSGPTNTSIAPHPSVTPTNSSAASSDVLRIRTAITTRPMVNEINCERHAPPRIAATMFFHATAMAGGPKAGSFGTRASLPLRERDLPICDERNRCNRSARCCVASRAASSNEASSRTTQR